MIIQITRKGWRIAGIVLAVAAAGCIYMFPQVLDPVFSRGSKKEAQLQEDFVDPIPDDSASSAQQEELPVQEVLMAVHVSGAVQKPDQVWYLPEGSRVSDAISAAGGARKKADLSQLNLAQAITDGMKIYVPVQGEIDDNSSTFIEKNTVQDAEQQVNINTADTAELVSLPGIGPAYADRIIQYRNENGPFSTVEELCNVKGIGEKTLEKIRSRICV